MGKIREISLAALKPSEFIKKKAKEIADEVQGGIAINALSGGVDSSVVTPLKTKTVSIPDSIPATISVSIRSPMITVSSLLQSIIFFACLSISGFGFPIKYA